MIYIVIYLFYLSEMCKYFKVMFSRVYILGYPGNGPDCFGHTRVGTWVFPEYTVGTPELGAPELRAFGS